jgi:hypothetical protein
MSPPGDKSKAAWGSNGRQVDGRTMPVETKPYLETLKRLVALWREPSALNVGKAKEMTSDEARRRNVAPSPANERDEPAGKPKETK